MDSRLGKYLDLARFQADLFSKDPHTKVAAIMLAPDSFQVLSTGYNGIPRKVEELPERWERPEKYRYVVHAEANAICNAARAGVAIKDAILVVTMFPCAECTKLIIQSGISRVVAPEPDLSSERWGSQFALSLEMMKEAGITIICGPNWT
jgi:dCMP deaminase